MDLEDNSGVRVKIVVGQGGVNKKVDSWPFGGFN